MKKIITICLLVMLSLSNIVYSEVGKPFYNNYIEFGIEEAVSDALTEGINPFSIANAALVIEGLNPQHLLKAFYCEEIEGDTVKQVADNHGISEVILLSAFERSIVECGEATEDSQAYTPINNTFSGVPTPTSETNRTPASPSTFN